MNDLPELLIGSDNTLKVDALRDADDVYVNDATVTAQVTDSTDSNVGSAVTLDYVATSNGNYRGVLDSTVSANLTTGNIYTVTYSMSNPAGLSRTIRCKHKAVLDTC